MLDRSLPIALMICLLASLPVCGQVAEQEPNYANQKIRADKDLPLYRDHHAEKMKFWKAQVEQYDTCTSDPPEVREKAKSYILDALSHCFAPSNYRGAEALIVRADALFKANSKDPLVILVAARVRQLKSADPLRTNGTLTANQAKLEAAKYGESFQLLNHLWQVASVASSDGGSITLNHDTRDNPKAPALVKRVLRWLQTDATKQGNQRVVFVLVENVFRILHPNDRSVFYDEIQQAKDLNPWLKEMIVGEIHYMLAWQHRGSGYASSVTPKGMKMFLQNLDLASVAFHRAIEANPRHPNPYAWMISVAEGRSEEPGKEMRMWFDKAVDREFDHELAYTNYRHGLQPQWHGSSFELFCFAKQCSLTKRLDTDVPLYARGAITTIGRGPGRMNWWDYPGAFELLRQVLLEAIQDPSRKAPQETWVIDSAACSRMLVKDCVRANRYDASREAIDLCYKNNAKGNQAFTEDPRSLLYTRIYATTTNGKESATRLYHFLKDLDATDSPESLAKMRAIIQSVPNKDLHPRARPFYDFAELVLDDREAFLTGKWVDLPFDARGFRWHRSIGLWERLPDNTYRGTRRENERELSLMCRPDFEPPFEIEVTMSINNPKENKISAGLIVNNPRGVQGKDPAFVFYRPSSRRVGMHIYDRKPGGWASVRFGNVQKCTDAEKVNRLKVYVYRTQIEFYLNDKFVSKGSYKATSPRMEFSLGNKTTFPMVGSAEFQNVRIRKLRWDAPIDLTTMKEYIAYYAQRIQDDPDDASNYFFRGIQLVFDGRPREGLKDFEKTTDTYGLEWDLMSTKAVAYFRLGEYDKAKPLFEEVNRRWPNFARLTNRYVWALASCPDKAFRDPDKASRLALRVCSRNQFRSEVYVNTLAAALAAQGKFKQAVKRQEQAIALYEKSHDEVPKVYFHRLAMYERGEVYYERFDKDGAKIKEPIENESEKSEEQAEKE